MIYVDHYLSQPKTDRVAAIRRDLQTAGIAAVERAYGSIGAMDVVADRILEIVGPIHAVHEPGWRTAERVMSNLDQDE